MKEYRIKTGRGEIKVYIVGELVNIVTKYEEGDFDQIVIRKSDIRQINRWTNGS